LRTPEGTNINRINTLNEGAVKRYLKKPEMVMGKYKFLESNTHNVDEMGISTIQKPGRILEPKAQKQIGAAIS
jgi:ABC-type branched-subunit amino acid transport system substrate-binding protein